MANQIRPEDLLPPNYPTNWYSFDLYPEEYRPTGYYVPATKIENILNGFEKICSCLVDGVIEKKLSCGHCCHNYCEISDDGCFQCKQDTLKLYDSFEAKII